MRRDFRVLVDDVLWCYIRGGFHHTVTYPTLKNLMAAPEDEFRRRDVKNTHTQRQHGIRFVLFFALESVVICSLTYTKQMAALHTQR